MIVNICVSQKDIDEGVRGSCRRCPVARAISRRLKKPYFAHAGRFQVLLHLHRNPNVLVNTSALELPDRITKFIEEFDARKASSPTSFKLNIPKRYLKTKKRSK